MQKIQNHCDVKIIKVGRYLSSSDSQPNPCSNKSFIRCYKVVPAIYINTIVIPNELGTTNPHITKIDFLPNKLYPISKKLSGLPGTRSLASR